jgi:diacylglycerol kinase family enzyme
MTIHVRKTFAQKRKVIVIKNNIGARQLLQTDFEQSLVTSTSTGYGYYFAILKNILFYREQPFQINGDKLIYKGKLLLVMVNNSSTTGGGFNVSPLSSVTDGMIDLVIAKPLNILKRLLYLPKVQKGEHMQLPVVAHFKGEHFTIECEKELYAQIDGDLMAAKTFRFSVQKNKFLFRY